MARKTTPASGRKQPSVTRGAKPAAAKARPAGVAAKKTTAARKVAAPASPKPKAAPSRAGRTVAAARTPLQSKQELRDRIEKLERANVVLRAKNREAVEASRKAADRIDQLEEQLARRTDGQDSQTASAISESQSVEPAAEPAKPATRRGRKPKAAPVPDETAVDDLADDHS